MTQPRTSAHQRVLLRGGSIYSPAAPFATAMLVDGPTIAWIGDDDAASSHADDAHLVIELDGRLVTPGFVDAHVHLGMTGLALASVDLGAARTLGEALDLLAGYARTFSGSVLFAHGWDEAGWPERRPPHIDEVDRCVGDAVAYVARVDSHSAVVSSALLAARPEIRAADGWTDNGRVERDAHHLARGLTDELLTEADRKASIGRALHHAASRGITSVHELNAPHIGPFADFAVIQDLAAERALPEVVPYWGKQFDGAAQTDFLLGYAGDLCMDGAVGSRTAAMRDPYADAETSGHLYLDEHQVKEHVVACTRAGKQAGFHVIGDRAMDEVAAGLGAAAEVVGVDAMVAARHRLEHVEMPDHEVIDVLARLGVVASVQPPFDAAWGAPGELYDQRLGWTRARSMNPFGSMARAGVVLAFGSDSPITPLDPWGGVRAAAFHHDIEERLTVRAAFNAHTRGGHRARGDDEAGVLQPGSAASYAVWELSSGLTVQTPDARVAAWSTDVRAGVPLLPDLSPGERLPQCVRTVVDGREAYSAEA